MITPKDVRIKFKTSQEQDGQKDRQSKLLNGKRYERKGGQVLQFRDDEGEDKVVCVVEIREDEVTIRRSGTIESEMRFVQDEQQEFRHKNAFGCVYFRMHTKELQTNVTEDVYDLRVVYDLISGGAVISTNTVEITAK